MTDPISQFGRISKMDPSVRQATAKGEQRVASSKPEMSAPAARANDQVTLSDVALQAMKEPEFDRSKVESIKQAIQQGQYPLDARRIAENFVAIEKMIKG